MTPDELRPILHGYRQRVQPAWSKATAHPDHEAADGSPVGQCGVTSAWVQWELAVDYGIDARYCMGDVLLHGKIVQWDHCWLEIGTGRDRLIADLTAGQIPGVSDLDILFAPYWELSQDGISYLPWFRMVAEQLADDPVQDRLTILTKAIS
jgi:hypothetical protein